MLSDFPPFQVKRIPTWKEKREALRLELKELAEENGSYLDDLQIERLLNLKNAVRGTLVE